MSPLRKEWFPQTGAVTKEALFVIAERGKPHWSAATRLVLIGIMSGYGPWTARQISDLVGLSPAAVTQACIRLYADGALTREYVLVDRGRAYAYELSEEWVRG